MPREPSLERGEQADAVHLAELLGVLRARRRQRGQEAESAAAGGLPHGRGGLPAGAGVATGERRAAAPAAG